MAVGFQRPISRRVAAGGLAAAAGLGAAAGPRRIVSLNPCLDAQLVHIADRRQIAGLSRLSRDPATSTLADLAATLCVLLGGLAGGRKVDPRPMLRVPGSQRHDPVVRED